ncbi:hypothetical protein V8E53_012431 [Lactarius tabidus]
MDRFPNSRTSFASRSSAVGHVPTSESTKRRRLSGLNSRFDRMLWEANLTTRTFKSLSRRHKHAYSSSSSSISNYEPVSASTHTSKDVELGTGEPCFVVVAEEIQPPRTMQQIGAGLSPWSNNGDQVIGESCQSAQLPHWLDNTLATLPPSHPVRRLILPFNRPIVRNLIDQNPGVSDERAVFAFQPPPYEVLPPSIINSDSGTGSSDFRGNPFEVIHNGSVAFRENTHTMLHTVPFSTPGPGCAISRTPVDRYPWEGNPILSRTMDNGSQEAVDAPHPFSTPGPFASPRPVSGHVFGSYVVAPHMLLDEVSPTIQKSGAVPLLSSQTTKSDRIDTPLFPVQDGGGQVSPLPNLMPGLSSSPTLAAEHTFPGDRGAITLSPDLTWLSPVGLTGRAAVDENIAYDDVSMLNSDDLLSQKTPFCASSLSRISISPKHEGESLPVLRRHMASFDTCPRTPMAPQQSMLQEPFPTNFDWISPNAQRPESSESIDREDGFDVNPYTPVAVVSELAQEKSGIFAPTRDIFLSPLLESDAPDSWAHRKRCQWERARHE